ncbi:MAG TPA: hypothetical protein VIU87_14785, partial [Mycobacterium sp.]
VRNVFRAWQPIDDLTTDLTTDLTDAGVESGMARAVREFGGYSRRQRTRVLKRTSATSPGSRHHRTSSSICGLRSPR